MARQIPDHDPETSVLDADEFLMRRNADGVDVRVPGTSLARVAKSNTFSGNVQTIKADNFTAWDHESYRDSSLTHALVRAKAARGTESSPAALQDGDAIYSIEPRPHDGFSFTGGGGNRLEAVFKTGGETQWSTVGGGHTVGSPTGGYKGTGTINSAELYENGQRVGPISPGTWTPVLEGTTTAGTNSYASQIGRYKRIGQTVFITGEVKLDGTAGALDSTGSLRVVGLPFAVSTGGSIITPAIELPGGGALPAGNYISSVLEAGTTNLNLNKQAESSASSLTDSEATNSLHVRFAVTYDV